PPERTKLAAHLHAADHAGDRDEIVGLRHLDLLHPDLSRSEKALAVARIRRQSEDALLSSPRSPHRPRLDRKLEPAQTPVAKLDARAVPRSIDEPERDLRRLSDLVDVLARIEARLERLPSDPFPRVALDPPE